MLSAEQRQDIENELLLFEGPDTEIDILESLVDSDDQKLDALKAIQLCTVLKKAGNHAEVVNVAVEILEGACPKTTAETIKLYWMAGSAASQLKQYRDCSDYLHKALEFAQNERLEKVVARLKLDFASLTISTGDLAKGIAEYEEAIIDLTRQSGTAHDLLRARVNIASAYLRANRLEEALQTFTGLVDKQEIVNSQSFYPVVLLNLAITHKRRQDHSQSLKVYQDLLSWAKEHNDLMFEMNALIGITDLNVIIKDLGEARATINQASRLLGNTLVSHMRSLVQAHMASVAHAEGDLQLAIDGLHQAFKDVLDSQDLFMALHYGRDLALWLAESGDYKKAYQIQSTLGKIQEDITGEDVSRAIGLTKIRTEFDNEKKRLESMEEAKNAVLHSVLPKNIASRLIEGEDHIADRIDKAAVLFADIVGFTNLSGSKDPETIVDILEQLFQKMDEVAGNNGCERIKTIGDAYMAMATSTDESDEHIVRLAKVAVGLKGTIDTNDAKNLQVRIGIHCGPVVAGVMRGSRLSYDVWGDTVNVASRMEELSNPGRILCSEEVAAVLSKDPQFKLEKREPLNVRGKGLLQTYWLSGRK